jgi:hypothetical protein
MLSKPARLRASRIAGIFLLALSMLSWLFLRVVPRMTGHSEYESLYGWLLLSAILLFVGLILVASTL